jgi:hypothetical protein
MSKSDNSVEILSLNSKNKDKHKFKPSKFFRFLNKKKIKKIDDNDNNNNNNIVTKTTSEKSNFESENVDNIKSAAIPVTENNKNSLISYENCTKVQDFLKKIDLESKNLKLESSKKNGKTNHFDIYRFNMNNCIKLLSVSGNEKTPKLGDDDIKKLNSNQPKVTIIKDKVDETKHQTILNNELKKHSAINIEHKKSKISNISEYNETITNNQDDASSSGHEQSELISLISKYELFANLGSNKQTVLFDNQKNLQNQNNNNNSNNTSNNSKQSSYSCLNAGSKLVELVHNFMKK